MYFNHISIEILLKYSISVIKVSVSVGVRSGAEHAQANTIFYSNSSQDKSALDVGLPLYISLARGGWAKTYEISSM